MTALGKFHEKLECGTVYKRSEMLSWSKSIDRHLRILLEEGFLKKCGPGLYLCLNDKDKLDTPIDERELVTKFLGDKRFLILNRKSYIEAGLPDPGIHTRTVYNHKRHGLFTLGETEYHFRVKPYFPAVTSREFLIVDMINNLDEINATKKISHENYIHKYIGTCNEDVLKKFGKEFADARARKYMRKEC